MPLFFVSITKTTGTSFWLAAMVYFGQSLILYDYAKKALELSDAGQLFPPQPQLIREPA